MQAIWKGSISFGLVTIPVKVFGATDEKNISFRQVHTADGGRIRYRRVCEVDGEEVAYSDIGRGRELPDGRMVVLTADDFAELPLPTQKVVDVLEFVPAEEIDPIYVSKSYYLEADKSGIKPYVLLREALVKSARVAIVKVALRSREALGVVRPRGDVLLLQTLLWPDEVRDDAFAAPAEDVDVRPAEVAMAESLVQTLESSFDPSRYHDEYREALEQLIEAKQEGVELQAPETPGPAREVVDLMAALQASVDAAKQQRGETPSNKPSEKPSGSAAKKTGTKKSAEKRADKAAGKKSAETKPPGKKAAEKKTAAKRATASSSGAKKSTAKKSAKKQTASAR